MTKTTKIVLGVIGGLLILCLVGAASAGAGFVFGRGSAATGLIGLSAMRRFSQEAPGSGDLPYRMPMFEFGPFTEDDGCREDGNCPRQPHGGGRGWLQDEFRMPHGMFGIGPEEEFGRDGRMGPNSRMWGFTFGSVPLAEPIPVDEAVAAAEQYLAEVGASGLEVSEVMVFDNHAYVEVKDPETGEGALELLVDPVSRRAILEFGPSMMWNTEYGMLTLGGIHGGMMGPWAGPQATPQGEMTVTPEQAIEAAQAYLDQAFPGRNVSTEAETFPGYYTLHVIENGEVVGMVSVNGYTGRVIYHHWHGELLEIEEIGE